MVCHSTGQNRRRIASLLKVLVRHWQRNLESSNCYQTTFAAFVGLVRFKAAIGLKLQRATILGDRSDYMVGSTLRYLRFNFKSD